MIEALKELAGMMKDLPNMAIWILGGFLFYKLFIAGSIVGAITMVSKLLINRVHDFKTKPSTVTREVSIDGRFITLDGTYDRFCRLLGTLTGMTTTGISMQYIHNSDVEWLEDAVKEKKERDKSPRNVTR